MSEGRNFNIGLKELALADSADRKLFTPEQLHAMRQSVPLRPQAEQERDYRCSSSRLVKSLAELQNVMDVLLWYGTIDQAQMVRCIEDVTGDMGRYLAQLQKAVYLYDCATGTLKNIASGFAIACSGEADRFIEEVRIHGHQL